VGSRMTRHCGASIPSRPRGRAACVARAEGRHLRRPLNMGIRRLRHVLPSAGVALSLFIAATGASGVGQASATRPAVKRGAHIVFVSNRDGDADIYAADLIGRVAAITRNRRRDDYLVVSRDGRWLATQRDLGKLVLISGDGRRERSLGEGTPVAFSPDSRTLIFYRENVLTEIDRMFTVRVPGGRPRALGRGLPLAPSPNGRLLAFTNWSDILGIVETETARRRIVPHSQFRDFLGWSPDSTHIALERLVERGGTKRDTLLVANARRPSVRPRAILQVDEDLHAEWISANLIGYTGKRAGSCEGGIVSLSGAVKSSFAPLYCFSADWSPRGASVAYQRPGGNSEAELVVASGDGSNPRVVDRGGNLSARWSRSGRLLAVHTGEELIVVRSDGTGRLRLARGTNGFPDDAHWSPDDRVILVRLPNGLGVVYVAGRTIRRVWTGPLGRETWVAERLSRRAPTAKPPRPSETAKPRLLRSHGKIKELGTTDLDVAALVGPSRADCDHVIAWTAGTRGVTRFSYAAPCGDWRTYDFDVTRAGTTINWRNYFCGTYCYVTTCEADVRRPFQDRCGEGGDEVPVRPPRPAPPSETRRGVSITTSGGTIALRREQDGRIRAIRPSGGAVDAELEDEGLFYAFNLQGQAIPGRIVFVPFGSLFP
jgi:hypothetical protein